MKILLRKDVKGVGRRGDIAEVKSGFFRNYLLPNGVALAATDSMADQSASMRKGRDLRDAATRQAAEVQRDEIAKAALERLGLQRADMRLDLPQRKIIERRQWSEERRRRKALWTRDRVHERVALARLLLHVRHWSAVAHDDRTLLRQIVRNPVAVKPVVAARAAVRLRRLSAASTAATEPATVGFCSERRSSLVGGFGLRARFSAKPRAFEAGNPLGAASGRRGGQRCIGER